MSLSNPTSPNVSVQSPLTSFGEIKTADAYPRVQIDGVYGLASTDFETFIETSGTTTSSGSLLTDLRLEPGDVLAICVATASSTAVVDASVN